jgi:site-specific DNA recombinase
MSFLCAVYARYSSDLQRPTSIEDQIRICREYANSHGFEILNEHIYIDEALCGVGGERPGLCKLLAAALSFPRPFDIILIDDSSRLSRNTANTLGMFEKLNFAGVRLIAISQGIDSNHEQAQVLVTVHGMVDSLYVQELAKKTHRGLDGSLLRGRHTGGRIFGYDNVALPDNQGVVLVVNQAEAVVVRRIFQMSAKGVSLKKIATTLNEEHLPTPRPQARNGWATWCHTAIREMLYRELYAGTVIWNRSKFVRVPGTNRRVRRMRPQSEWRIVQREELRIIEQDLWEQVKRRLNAFKELYHSRVQPGLLPRSETTKFLFSGLLKCGRCGGNLAIVAGGRKDQYRKYGCSQHWYRGACSNNLLERQEWLEKRLLADLQTEVLRPEAVDYTIAQFGEQLKAALGKLSGELSEMRARKQRVEVELRRLTETAAQTGPSAFLVQAINQREQELRQITDKLLASGPESVDARLEEIRIFVNNKLKDIRQLLSNTDFADPTAIRAELRKHVSEIRLTPRDGKPRGHYLAEGAWDLVGKEEGPAHNSAPVSIRMVAGGGFEPPTFGL